MNRIIGQSMALRAFGFAKIPMIAYLWPSVVDSTPERCELKIPLTWRSKNHLGGMYFGALAVGGDLALGLPVFEALRRSNKKFSFVFKDARFNFLKRAEDDVHFICDECGKVAELIAKAEASGEREHETVYGYAVVPRLGADKVAEFWLTLSLKIKS